MVKVEKLIPGGMGLGVDQDGKKIFFWNALPGETVTEYRVTKNKHRFTEAVALQIIDQSPHRVKPLDDCFLSTSPWQIMDYDYELAAKPALVQEVFREHHINIPKPAIHTDHHPYHYRNKMEYSLYWDHDTSKIHLAFHERGSHRKVPITSSSLERTEIYQAAQRIIDELNSRHAEARKYQSLILRCNQLGEVSGGLLENGQPHPVFPHLTDTILGYTYSYSPNGFFQINLPVYELALQEIKRHITTDHVLDLYSGVGTIGLSVAPDKHLMLVEVDKFAFNEMVKNIKEKYLLDSRGSGAWQGEEERASPMAMGASDAPREYNKSSPTAILAKSEEVLNYITPNQTVILDPPRAGCDTKLLEKLLEVTPPKIIYLSCNPATQARDVQILLSKYHITAVETFNFFPRTPHIENLVVLSL